MKKLLIFLLVLVILGGLTFGAYLYFWTPENFSAWGENAMGKGKHESAVTFYEVAVDLDPDNVDYVIALMNAHLADGNYTKAERTLVKAIRVAPCARLYCELSTLYVLQDKILDAQLMLDTISNEAIRAEIEAMRPNAPVFEPAPGEYEELVEWTVNVEGGKVYYSTNGDFPSSHTEPYTAPLPLSSGTTHIRAILVGDNGLVSPVVDGSYLVRGIVEELTFESPELEAYIRELLYIPRTAAVLSSDLWDVTELNIPETVTNFNDLIHFPALVSLTIHDSMAEDYSVFDKLTQLQSLDLSGSLVSFEALEHVGTLRNLTHLNLQGCGISNIEALANLTAMKWLNLADNSITHISSIVEMKELQYLNLKSNGVVSLDALNGIQTLTEFDISGNKVTTLAPLQHCTNMQILHVDSNELMSVGALSHMVELTVLTAAYNHLEDISALSNSTKMTHMDVSNNLLSSVDCIAQMPYLTELNISHNEVLSIPNLEPTFRLQRFYASHNRILKVDPLAVLQELAIVDVDYNEDVMNIEVLASCRLLVQVNAFGTHVKEVKNLTDLGIIVNFDPSYGD